MNIMFQRNEDTYCANLSIYPHLPCSTFISSPHIFSAPSKSENITFPAIRYLQYCRHTVHI